MKLRIYTDGASRGNPGKASYGFLIKDEDGVILHQEGKYIGVATNNVAEYTAVLKSFEYIKKHQKKLDQLSVELITDSLLIASQLAGKFKIKNLNLKEIYLQIKSLEEDFKGASYRNV